ncbi:NUDIX hydrolase domain-like protein, partial [Xylogone sp. PMI_703]
MSQIAPDGIQQQAFNFTSHPSVSSFSTADSITTAPQAYLSNYPGIKCKYTAASALVFEHSNPTCPRILLVQRSQSGTRPGLWEFPGGGCEDDDRSILHAAARELWEETGLNARSIGPLIGKPHFTLGGSGKLLCKFSFLVQVKMDQGIEGPPDV